MGSPRAALGLQKGCLNLALLVCFPELASLLLLLLRRREVRLRLHGTQVPAAPLHTFWAALPEPTVRPRATEVRGRQAALFSAAASCCLVCSFPAWPPMLTPRRTRTDDVAADSLRALRPQRGRCTERLRAREGPSAGQQPRRQVQGQGGLVAGGESFPHASHMAF